MKTPYFDPRDNSIRNLLGNSNLENWQRGINFTGLGANQVYTADRFQWAGGTLTATLSAARVAITGANSAIIPTRKISYAIRYGVSVAQPSLAAGASAGPWIKVEGYDILPLAESGSAGFTFSFYARAFRTGIYNVQFANTGLNRNYVTTFTINSTDTWQRVVVSVPYLDVGNGTWNFTNGIGMYVRIWMAAGSSAIGATPNVWQALGAAQIANGQVNAVQSTSDYLEMTGFMLYSGKEEKEFVTRENSVQKEFQFCQRYCQVIENAFGGNIATGILGFIHNAQNNSHFGFNLPVALRALPLISSSNTIHSTGSGISSAVLTFIGTTAGQSTNVSTFIVPTTINNNIVIGTTQRLEWPSGTPAGAKLFIDAEL